MNKSSLEYKYTEAIVVYNYSWSVLFTFWKMPRIASPLLEDYEIKGTEKIVAFADQKNDPKLQFKEIMEASVKDSLITWDTALQASALIFAHTILDECTKNLCTITSKKFKDRWNKSIATNNVKITGSELLTCTQEELKDKLIDKKLEKLKGSSLPERAKFLCSMCNPPKDWEFSPGYKFNITELNKFDKLRHAIVHSKRMSKKIPMDFEQMMEFINLTGLYLIVMVGQFYEVTEDNELYMKLFMEFQSESPYFIDSRTNKN